MRQLNVLLVAAVGVCGALAPHTLAAIITQTDSGGFPASITGTLPNKKTALVVAG